MGVILAGHLCLDVIPPLYGNFRFVPGSMMGVGPATISTGGCVPNTGVALHRLGVKVRLLGKVGDDPFGRIVRDSLASVDRKLTEGLLDAPGESTSYTVTLSPPGEDRMFLHYPGTNDAFSAADLPDDLRSVLPEAHIFHFGYPPVMRRMYENDKELAQTMRRARAAGLTTSLDMCYPSPGAKEADWGAILEAALPEVDVFLPSLEEMLLMLEPGSEDEPVDLARTPVEGISRLADRLIGLGAGIVVIKCGARGLYLRTASQNRLEGSGPALAKATSSFWANRELWSSSFEVGVVGNVGAGDAAVAGFLLGLLDGQEPEGTLTAACAAGASSVEAVDTTSGVRSWPEIKERIEGGWPRSIAPPADGWLRSKHPGIWRGPKDSG